MLGWFLFLVGGLVGWWISLVGWLIRLVGLVCWFVSWFVVSLFLSGLTNLAYLHLSVPNMFGFFYMCKCI